MAATLKTERDGAQVRMSLIEAETGRVLMARTLKQPKRVGAFNFDYSQQRRVRSEFARYCITNNVELV